MHAVCNRVIHTNGQTGLLFRRMVMGFNVCARCYASVRNTEPRFIVSFERLCIRVACFWHLAPGQSEPWYHVCVQVLLDLIADATELDTVSQAICCPEPSDLWIDVYQPLTQVTEGKRSSHLHVAAAVGSPVMVEMVTGRGAGLLTLDSDHNTPLITLTRSSPLHTCLSTMRTLLRGRSGAWVKSYVDALNSRGLGALHYAVARGLDDVVMYLLDECQACVDPYRIPDSGPDGRYVGFSPLHMAIMRNNHWAVGRLLAAGADVSLFIPIFVVKATAAHAEVPVSCDCGCGFSQQFRIAPPPLFCAGRFGVFLSSTLGLAAYLEDGDTVEALVKAGADVDGRDSWGATSLNVAVFCSNYRCTLTLLSLGADTGTCVCGDSLLHVAVSVPVEEPFAARHCKLLSVNTIVLELIVTGNVPINGRDIYGNTPLILACRNGYFMTIPLLVVSGSSLSSVDDHGRSALFFAAVCAGLKRDRLMVKSLVHFGAACLERLPRSWDDGAMQRWTSPALAALYYLDTLTLFLLYKGGALRNRRLIALLKQVCLEPRNSERWLRLFHCSTAAAPPALPSPRNHDARSVSTSPGGSPYDAEQETYRYEVYTTAEMEDLFHRDESDWKNLLSFCELSEHHCSLQEHDAANTGADQSDDSSSGVTPDHPKLMQLAWHFLQTVSTTVPSLLYLSRWAVRDAIGDDPLARKRAMLTLPLPSAVMERLMIGCMQAA